MLFKRFYDEALAQASYLIGCGATGEAVVVDPSRVVAPYLEAAAAEGLRITAVTETHIHADFVSGLRELAARTGATMFVSGCGTPDWQYGFSAEPQAAVLRDRDRIRVGNVQLEAVHSPGHTPEHLSFLVTDARVTDQPMGVVTGDFVFVGDVGRPDLLEKAARIADTAVAGARQLFASLRWFKRLPDHLQVWPGHGAGSACGKGLSAVPQSTVGYERRYNWALAIESEAEFVRQVLSGQPDPPRYFARMKRVNREGPPVLGELPRPAAVSADRLGDLLAAGATVVDTRPAAEFARAHVPGTVNVPLNRNFPTYGGSVLDYDRDLYFLLADPQAERVAQLVELLISIGFDRIAGVMGPEVLERWRREGGPVGTVGQVTVGELAARPGNGLVLLDVRNGSEWDEGHIAGARHLPLPQLLDRLHEIPPDANLLVMCQSGARSAIAASVLKARGRERVTHLVGGFSAWAAAGGAVER
jgi:hydroxyacylglutathione hydrolase